MMTTPDMAVIRLFVIFIPLLLVAGLYCIIVTRNLIRILIGVELLSKAVVLTIVVAGYVTNRMALAQAMAITMIIIEVVVIAIAAGIIINIFRHYDSLDTRNLEQMKG